MKKRAATVATNPRLLLGMVAETDIYPGRINWLTEISTIAGGLNEFRDVELASVQTDWEDVLDRKPDYILLAWVGVRTEKVKKKVVLKRPGWKELTAVKENRFSIMEEELYCRPSPRLLEGALKLGKMIHPEIYDDLELPKWIQCLKRKTAIFS